jgi:hypothetical protein
MIESVEPQHAELAAYLKRLAQAHESVRGWRLFARKSGSAADFLASHTGALD